MSTPDPDFPIYDKALLRRSVGKLRKGTLDADSTAALCDWMEALVRTATRKADQVV